MQLISFGLAKGEIPHPVAYHPSCNFPGLLQQDFKELLAW